MAKYNFNKPCAVCGRVSPNRLCPTHQAQADEMNKLRLAAQKEKRIHYSGAYKRLSKIVRDTAITCHLCGETARFGDPFEADHLFPGQPVTDISQLAPAHRSCNIARGNKPLN